MNKIWDRVRKHWPAPRQHKSKQASNDALAKATRLVLDDEEYLRCHPDVQQSGASPAEHFLHHGHHEGRMPGDPASSSFLHRTQTALPQLPGNPHVAAWHLSALLTAWQPGQDERLDEGWQALLAHGMRPEDIGAVVAQQTLRSYLTWRGGIGVGHRQGLSALVDWWRTRLPTNTELELVAAAWLFEAGDLAGSAAIIAQLDLPAPARTDMAEVIQRPRQYVADAEASLQRSRQSRAAGDLPAAAQALARARVTRLDEALMQETAEVAAALGDLPHEEQARFDLARLQGHASEPRWQPLADERAQRLLLLDTAFPSPISPFRFGEFSGYMQRFPQCVARTRFDHNLFRFGTGLEFPDQVAHFAQAHGIASDRVGYLLKDTDLRSKLAYTVFVNQADQFFTQMDVPARKLAFTLYPGGGFELGGTRSDAMLRRLFDDPRMERVVTTQRTSYEYLIERGFCKEDRIAHIYGGLVPTAMNPPTVDFEARARQRSERPLHICFVAHRYTATGAEKGYDVLVDVMKALAHDDGVHFHIVGGYDASVLDLGDVRHVTFHGPQPADFFPAFYAQMDIILSPNAALSALSRSGVGSFDGFPTGAVLEAGLHGVAMFMSDVLGMNQHIDGSPIFIPGEDAVIIDRHVEQIVEVIRHHMSAPAALRKMAEKGRQRLLQHFARDAQMQPRFELMQQLLD